MHVSNLVLAQLADQIRLLQPDQYAQPLAVFNGSSIGGHTRHIIEFYECLLEGMTVGKVNYDARRRDLAIEQNRDYALTVIERCQHKISRITDQTNNLMLVGCFCEDTKYNLPTNFAREEIYLIEHSIHHFALISIGIQEHFKGVEILDGFGVAHSTQRHRKEAMVENY